MLRAQDRRWPIWWRLRRGLFLRGCERTIRRFGWTSTFIGQGDRQLGSICSVGFWERLGAPEVIAFIQTPESGLELMREIYRRLRSGEITPRDMDPWPHEEDESPRLVWRAVHPSQIRSDWFEVALGYRAWRRRDAEGLRAFQLVISDEAYRFPWDDGFDASYRAIQEELWRPWSTEAS